MTRTISLLATWALALGSLLPAARAVSIETVLIGNAGNAPDTDHLPSNFYGGVAYEYRIGKFEVTNEQYAEFLNAVGADDPTNLYSVHMGGQPWGGILRSGSSGSYTYSVKPNYHNKPVTYITYWDAIRFVNWLHNGQPVGSQGSGTTEDGAYTLVGGTPVPSNATTVFRNSDARWFLPDLNEWYKAAYHDPRTASQGGPPSDDNYWFYPTQSDSPPTQATANSVGDISNPGANVANYNLGADWEGPINSHVTTVGSAGPLSASFYGTYDQAGNVWEWLDVLPSPNSIFRPRAGGSWNAGGADTLSPLGFVGVSTSTNDVHSGQNHVGFRVASVPEPSTAAIAAIGLLWLLGIGLRRSGRC